MNKIIINNIDDVIKFYIKCKSIAETSNEFKLSKSTIYRNLKKNGICTKLDRDKAREKHIKYAIDSNYFEKIDTHNKAYILGIIMSDGYMLPKRKQVRVKLTDIGILDSIKKELNYNKPYNKVRKYKESHKNSNLLIICNTKIYDDLIKLGCVCNKTFNCDLPDILDKYMPSFIRGFFDGDGCIYVSSDSKCAEVSIVATKIFCNSLHQYLISNDIDSFFRYDKRHDGRILIIRIKNKKSLIKTFRLLYDDILSGNSNMYLYRKFKKYIRFLKNKNWI